MPRTIRTLAVILATLTVVTPRVLPAAAPSEEKVELVISKGLDWLVREQSRRGSWAANEGRYPTAMTALAGTALLMEGSTTTQGKYAEPIRQAVDYLVSRSRPNGLIGDPKGDAGSS
jgi:squalene cyclase